MNKITKHTITATLTIALLAIHLQTSAATVYTSTGSGNWNTSFSSTGTGTPLVYKILSSHTIDVNVNGTSAIDSLIIFGTLDFGNSKKIDLSANGIIVLNTGGSVTGGNGASRFRFVGAGFISGSFAETGLSFASGGTGGSFISGGLPVDWLNIETTLSDNIYMVKWSTATEENNDYFEVQMSADGSAWNTMTIVPSLSDNGNSNRILNYSTSIDANVNGEVNYLRIRQIDFNGDSEYSKTIKLEDKAKQPLVIQYLLDGQIRIANSTKRPSTITIISLAGSTVSTLTVETSIDIQLPSNQMYIVKDELGFIQKIML
jgi:hypothetical protein